jgi:tRNA(Ile)-lysidine synthase
MPPPRGLVQLIDQRLHRSGFPRGARLLVAVSGGADSVALLRLLHEINQSDHWRWTLVVAHVDHGIRGAASRQDGRFVASLARGLGLACVTRRLALPRSASEDAARAGRLRALAAICRAKKCAAVVMAHHADDQAETVLMRLFRGTGIDGLAAMSAATRINGLTILRPLLEIRRSDLRDYLRQIEQPWREDATNASGLYLRNRLRHQLMPYIQVLWPRAVEALCRVAVLAEEASAAIAEEAGAFMARTPAWGALRGRAGARAIQFPRADFQQLPPAVASEVLRQVIAALGGSSESADFERLREARHMLAGRDGGKQIQLGEGLSISTRDALIRVERHAAERGPNAGDAA